METSLFANALKTCANEIELPKRKTNKIGEALKKII